MTEEEFLKKVRKDTRIYKRTVSFLKKLPSPFAKTLSWLLLHIASPRGAVAAAARRYKLPEE